MRAIPFVAASVLLFAGCIQSDPTPAGNDQPSKVPGAVALDERLPASAAAPRVVVAVIDTGINVYHDWFQRNASLPADVLASFKNSADQSEPIVVPIAKEGTYKERVEKDQETWDGLKPETLYYFEGTNVLGISFASVTATAKPVRDDAGHGSGTSGAVVQQNPNAIIVLVENFGARAEAWAAAQPWIDLVSMSYGPPGSVPGGGRVMGLETHLHTKKMWAAGQIPVGAADNSPALSPNDETAGPPWVVGVAGDLKSSGCRSHASGTFPDVTSDFTQVLPRHNDTTLTRSMSGTSFATPKTAGTLSAAIYQVRAAWNHTGGIVGGALAVAPDGARMTNANVREAFNRTATYFPATACQPGQQSPTYAPVNPVAPWLQMGWGHVGPELVPASVDHLLGLKAAGLKPDAARHFQGALYTYREALWNRI